VADLEIFHWGAKYFWNILNSFKELTRLWTGVVVQVSTRTFFWTKYY